MRPTAGSRRCPVESPDRLRPRPSAYDGTTDSRAAHGLPLLEPREHCIAIRVGLVKLEVCHAHRIRLSKPKRLIPSKAKPTPSSQSTSPRSRADNTPSPNTMTPAKPMAAGRGIGTKLKLLPTGSPRTIRAHYDQVCPILRRRPQTLGGRRHDHSVAGLLAISSSQSARGPRSRSVASRT